MEKKEKKSERQRTATKCATRQLVNIKMVTWKGAKKSCKVIKPITTVKIACNVSTWAITAVHGKTSFFTPNIYEI